MKKLFEKQKRIITHSAVECFQECRVKYDYRYNRELIPAEPQTALDFGTAIHAGLEFWFKYGIEKGALEAALTAGSQAGLSTENMIKVQAMLERYFEVYHSEPFEVIDVEKVFNVKLRNPKTWSYSKTFMFWGKVDGLVRIDKAYWILEHKTAREISADYLECLELRAQTALYAVAIEQETGLPIKGAIYDILKKPGLKMTTEETPEEFEARKAALLARSKTGKTTATRREGETFDSFMGRCREAITPDYFKRVEIIIGIERKREALDNLWRTAKDMMHAEIYPTSGACMKGGMVCPYMKLCKAHGDIAACADAYTTKQAHCELEEAQP